MACHRRASFEPKRVRKGKEGERGSTVERGAGSLGILTSTGHHHIMCVHVAEVRRRGSDRTKEARNQGKGRGDMWRRDTDGNGNVHERRERASGKRRGDTYCVCTNGLWCVSRKSSLCPLMCAGGFQPNAFEAREKKKKKKTHNMPAHFSAIHFPPSAHCFCTSSRPVVLFYH